MPRFVPLRQEQILAAMIPRVVVQGGLTDVSDSNGVLSILSAFADQLDISYYQMSLLLSAFSLNTAEGPDLDARAGDLGNLPRRQSIAATGTVVFTRNAVAGSVTIPEGTQVATLGGTTFRTTAPGQMTPTTAPSIAGDAVGQNSVPVPIVALVAGLGGNVASRSITSLSTRPAGTDGVINLAATAGGQDVESDDSYRARIYRYIAGLPRGTSQAITNAVLGAQDTVTGRTIAYASVVEDAQNPGRVSLLIDDGTGQAGTMSAIAGEVLTRGLVGPPPDSAVGGEVRLLAQNKPLVASAAVTVESSTRGPLTQGTDYTLAHSLGQFTFTPALAAGEAITVGYTYATGIIALAQKIADGDPADPANFPGYRAAGIVVDVRTPQTVTTSIGAVLTVSDGYDVPSVNAAVVSAITTLINGLGIGQDILRSSIIQAVMNVSGVVNVSLVTPSTDVAVLDDQLARVSASNVTVS